LRGGKPLWECEEEKCEGFPEGISSPVLRPDAAKMKNIGKNRTETSKGECFCQYERKGIEKH